jgi:hypothetical protein
VRAPRSWHVSYQWDRHSAVLLAPLTGDTARAASLLEYKRSFKDTQRFHDALKQTVADIERGGGRFLPGSPEEAAFQRLFDVIRQPEPGATAKPLGEQAVSDVAFRRFEFAVIKDRYVAGNVGTPVWDRVFRWISE